MGITIWAYVLATAGIVLGGYFVKQKQWKPACWIICFALLIVAGGNIQIREVSPSISDAFKITKEISAITNQLATLNVQVLNTVAMKQEVSQTVTLVTKVEKEIADIREAIKQFYAHSRGDLFCQKDNGGRVKIFNTNNVTVVYFQLKEIPVPESIVLTHKHGTSSPVTYSTFRNIVQYRCDSKPGEILNSDSEFYFIRYFKDDFTTETPISIEAMKYIGTSNQIDRAVFYYKEPN